MQYRSEVVSVTGFRAADCLLLFASRLLVVCDGPDSRGQGCRGRLIASSSRNTASACRNRHGPGASNSARRTCNTFVMIGSSRFSRRRGNIVFSMKRPRASGTFAASRCTIPGIRSAIGAVAERGKASSISAGTPTSRSNGPVSRNQGSLPGPGRASVGGQAGDGVLRVAVRAVCTDSPATAEPASGGESVRRQAGYRSLPIEVLPLRRRIVRPYGDDAATTKPIVKREIHAGQDNMLCVTGLKSPAGTIP